MRREGHNKGKLILAMRMTPILYLPGFNSGPQSEKSARLRQRFPQLRALGYDSWDPERGAGQIAAALDPLLAARPLLVGSSLGGFWAYQFANRHGLACVLLNPCMTPEVTLRPYIGAVEHMYSGERGELTLAHLCKYAGYRVAGNARCTVLHETGDQLIPYQESVQHFAGRARLILLPGGDHSFTDLAAAMREIDALLAPDEG